MGRALSGTFLRSATPGRGLRRLYRVVAVIWHRHGRIVAFEGKGKRLLVEVGVGLYESDHFVMSAEAKALAGGHVLDHAPTPALFRLNPQT
jgi:hypothetical protein